MEMLVVILSYIIQNTNGENLKSEPFYDIANRTSKRTELVLNVICVAARREEILVRFERPTVEISMKRE